MPYYRKSNMKGYRTKTYNTYGVTTGDVTSSHQNKERSEDQDKLNKKKRKRPNGRGSKAERYFKKGFNPNAGRKAVRDNTFDMVNALHEVFGIPGPLPAPKTKSWKRGQKAFKFIRKHGGKRRYKHKKP